MAVECRLLESVGIPITTVSMRLPVAVNVNGLVPRLTATVVVVVKRLRIPISILSTELPKNLLV
jgi:hypothetical protein